ncbi:MAG: hypothetical protein ACLRVT_01705 [Oscillospiraceae bacterium]
MLNPAEFQFQGNLSFRSRAAGESGGMRVFYVKFRLKDLPVAPGC